MDCRVVLDETAAMRTALLEAGDGEIVVLFYDDLPLAQKVLAEFGAEPLDSFEAMKLFSPDARPAARKVMRPDAQVELAR
jgi:hypothetical protein